MKKRKKQWTTKNTHIERKKGEMENDREPTDWKVIFVDWLVVIAAIIFIILVALNNHIVGYDHFIGIPREWIRSLK